jgi:hypothetical protein
MLLRLVPIYYPALLIILWPIASNMIWATLFYFVYSKEFNPLENPTVRLFQMYDIYRKEWIGIEFND